MSESVVQELRFFLISAASGILLGLVYDIFRIFRRLVSHGVWWVAVEDLLFFLFATLLVFSMIFAENDGSIRLFSMGSLIAGIVLYYISASQYLVRLSVWLIGFPFCILKKTVKKLKKTLVRRKKFR